MPDDSARIRISRDIIDTRTDLVRAFRFGVIPAEGTPATATDSPGAPPATASTPRVPGGGATGANRFPVVAVSDPQYYTVRVRLLGFYCETETWDNAIQSDGPRDEIFVRADVQEFDGNNKQVSLKNFETPVYGSTGFPPLSYKNRITAGTATSTGGIRSGDSVPDDIRNVAAQPQAFSDRLPLLLWEHNGVVGEQLDGYLFITPTLIEWDGAVDFLTKFGNDIANFLKGAGAVGVAAGFIPGVGAVVSGVGAVLTQAPKLIAELQKFLGSAGDRPVGQKLVEDTRTFDPQILSLNLAKIRDAADSDPLFLGRGVWGVTYQDDPGLGGGKYGAYVHIEHYVWPQLQ